MADITGKSSFEFSESLTDIKQIEVALAIYGAKMNAKAQNLHPGSRAAHSGEALLPWAGRNRLRRKTGRRPTIMADGHLDRLLRQYGQTFTEELPSWACRTRSRVTFSIHASRQGGSAAVRRAKSAGSTLRASAATCPGVLCVASASRGTRPTEAGANASAHHREQASNPGVGLLSAPAIGRPRRYP